MLTKSSSMSALSSLVSSSGEVRDWRISDFCIEGRQAARSKPARASLGSPFSSQSSTKPALAESASSPKCRDGDCSVHGGLASPSPSGSSGSHGGLRSRERALWDFENDLVPWPYIRRAQSETDLQNLAKNGGIAARLMSDTLGCMGGCQQAAGSTDCSLKGWSLPSPTNCDVETGRHHRRRWARRKSFSSFSKRLPEGDVAEVEEDQTTQQNSTGRLLKLALPCEVNATGSAGPSSVHVGVAQEGCFSSRSHTRSLTPEEQEGLFSRLGVKTGISFANSAFVQSLPSPSSLPFSRANSNPVVIHPEAVERLIRSSEMQDLEVVACKCSQQDSRSSHNVSGCACSSSTVYCFVNDSQQVMRSVSQSPLNCGTQTNVVGHSEDFFGSQQLSGDGFGPGGFGGGGMTGGKGGRRCGGAPRDWEESSHGNANSSSTDAYYQQALEKDPGHPLLLRNYARFLSEVQHDLVKAEEFYERAILANPGDGEVLAQYAKLIWEAHNDHERASSYFEQAIQAAPADCYVLAAYASFLWSVDNSSTELGLKTLQGEHRCPS